MRLRRSHLAAVSGTVIAGGALALSGATVASAPDQYRAALAPVPHPGDDGGSNASGRAALRLRGDTLDVQLKVRGVSPGLPHAVHIHGKDAGELAFCPGAGRADDIADDGLIETAEGLDDYGPVQVSFTTFGPTDAGSLLDLDRFPVAKQNGKFSYDRTITVPSDVAAHLDEKHIVVHGHDVDGNGTYDGVNSALGVPLEAELPVACGEIDAR